MSGSFHIVSSHNAISNVQCITQRRPPKVLSFHFKTLHPSTKSRLLSFTIAYLHKLIPFSAAFLKMFKFFSCFPLIARQFSDLSFSICEFKTVHQCWKRQAALVQSGLNQREREREQGQWCHTKTLKHQRCKTVKSIQMTLNHYDPTYSLLVHMAETL